MKKTIQILGLLALGLLASCSGDEPDFGSLGEKDDTSRGVDFFFASWKSFDVPAMPDTIRIDDLNGDLYNIKKIKFKDITYYLSEELQKKWEQTHEIAFEAGWIKVHCSLDFFHVYTDWNAYPDDVYYIYNCVPFYTDYTPTEPRSCAIYFDFPDRREEDDERPHIDDEGYGYKYDYFIADNCMTIRQAGLEKEWANPNIMEYKQMTFGPDGGTQINKSKSGLIILHSVYTGGVEYKMTGNSQEVTEFKAEWLTVELHKDYVLLVAEPNRSSDPRSAIVVMGLVEHGDPGFGFTVTQQGAYTSGVKEVHAD